jgi:hypothetical protein
MYAVLCPAPGHRWYLFLPVSTLLSLVTSYLQYCLLGRAFDCDHDRTLCSCGCFFLCVCVCACVYDSLCLCLWL